MTPLKIEIDDAVRKEVTALPVFNGSGGLQSGINPSSNTSMLDAADDQQGDATKRLREQAAANLNLAIDSATRATCALTPAQETVSRKTLREQVYPEDFRSNDRNATTLRNHAKQYRKA